MRDERRFDEDEVRKILDRAARPEAPGTAASAGDREGMTLAQLQEIGAEVGIDPARIAAAADAVTRRPTAPPPVPQRILGVPRSVARTVSIPRALDEDEWTRLVVDLRQTFGAQGRISGQGTLRSWNNGNLRIDVEPDGDRYRVRMHTSKGNAGPRIVMGSAFLFISVLMLISVVFGDGNLRVLVMGSLFGAGGIAQLGATRAMLRDWAAERAAQMEGLAERIPRLLESADQDA